MILSNSSSSSLSRDVNTSGLIPRYLQRPNALVAFSIPSDVLKMFDVMILTFFSLPTGTTDKVFDLAGLSFRPMLGVDFSTFDIDVWSPSLLEATRTMSSAEASDLILLV